MAYKPLNDWLDKHEGKKEGSSYENIQKERVRQGIGRVFDKGQKWNTGKNDKHASVGDSQKTMRKTFDKSRASLAKQKMAKKMSAHERSKTIKDAVSQAYGSAHLGKKGAPGLYPEQLTPKEKYYRKSNETRTNAKYDKFSKSGYGRHLDERARNRGEQDL